MKNKNYELELFRLITENNMKGEPYIEEFGWIDSESFCVWINYGNIQEFMKDLTNIFGYGIFDDGSFHANMQAEGICIDLCEALLGLMEIEEIEDAFPKSKYRH